MPPTGKVLITGASGFIGRALCARFVATGRSVRALTRGTGVPGAEVIRVTNFDATTDWMGAVNGVEAVVHLAARAHVLHDRSADPLPAYRAVNRDGTLQLAKAAREAGARRFIFVSSIGVLGERTSGTPFSADSVPAPEAPYAVSKWEAEQGLAEVASKGGMEIVVIRPTLVHGAGAPGNFARLLRLVASGWPLPFAGIDGRRTFISRSNLCDLIEVAMVHPEAPQRPLLAGDSETLTLPELLRTLAEGMNRPSRLFPLPGLRYTSSLPVAGRAIRKLTDSLVVDTSETRARLGWTPRLSARDGILEMARAWVTVR